MHYKPGTQILCRLRQQLSVPCWHHAPMNAEPYTRTSTDNASTQPTRPVSRQRLWQLKQRAEGCCWRCGQPAVGSLCPEHLAKERERQRRINGYNRRRLNARSYILAPRLEAPTPRERGQIVIIGASLVNAAEA